MVWIFVGVWILLVCAGVLYVAATLQEHRWSQRSPK